MLLEIDIYKSFLYLITFLDKNICKRDYGGPMVVSKSASDNSAIVFGVASKTFNNTEKPSSCGTPRDRPSIFTRVSKYLKWIRSHLKNKTENGTSSKRTLYSQVGMLLAWVPWNTQILTLRFPGKGVF